MVLSNNVCKEWLDKGMCGILPVYGQDGANISHILFEGSSSVYEPRRVTTVVKQLAKFYYKDIELIKKGARKVSGQRTGNALPISHDVILIPFKTRIPIGRDDGSLGYIFKSSIDKVVETDSKTYLYLKDGQVIHILDSARTARNRIAMAHCIEEHMLNGDIVSISANLLSKGISLIYNEYISKEDMYLFLYKKSN